MNILCGVFLPILKKKKKKIDDNKFSLQMENHGVQMKVHESKDSYELAYESNFLIKEGGQIEIKHGSVLTYLV